MEWKNYSSDVTIQSPPKLTRIVQLDSSKFLHSSSTIEPKHKDDDHCENRISSQFSLPDLAGEVADAQKQQATELSKRQDAFVALEKEYTKVQQKINKVKEDVSLMTRKVILTEEDVFQCNSQCQWKEKGIKELLALERQLKAKGENERKQLQKEQIDYVRYFDKMGSHRSMVEEYESSNDVGRKISIVEDETGLLTEEVCGLRDGQNQNVMGITEEYDILQTEIIHLKQAKQDTQHGIEQRKHQTKIETERQAQLQKDIHLLQKRNHAQLTRLQKQLQEALGRSRHWNEEACKLESSIAQIRDKIEE